MSRPNRENWSEVGRRIAGLADAHFGEGEWNYRTLATATGRSTSSVHRDLTGKGLTLYAALHYRRFFRLPKIEYLEPRWKAKENEK